MVTKPRKYRKISISEEIVEKVEKIIEEGNLGYRSISDFMHEAVRLRLQEIMRRKL